LIIKEPFELIGYGVSWVVLVKKTI